MHERGYWQVCVDHDDGWQCLSSHKTRAEAEIGLRNMRPMWPGVFLVRVTLTRMDQARARPLLTRVPRAGNDVAVL
jgi:hypothetical protein